MGLLKNIGKKITEAEKKVAKAKKEYKKMKKEAEPITKAASKAFDYLIPPPKKKAKQKMCPCKKR